MKELEDELEGLSNSRLDGEYLYKIDSRYEEIKKRLLIISSQASQSLTTESEYWESYRAKRKQDLQAIQVSIN